MAKNNQLVIFILFFSAITVAFIIFAFVITMGIYPWSTLNQVANKSCAQEAKLCPDGSAVGRTGPNCEFALCPEEEPEACKDLCGDGVCQEVVCMAIGCPCAETAQSCPQDCAEADTSDWQTYRNEEFGFEVRYPDNWQYIDGVGGRTCLKEIGRQYKIEGDEVDCYVSISIRVNDKNQTALDIASNRNKYGGMIKNFSIETESVSQVTDYLGVETYLINNGKVFTFSTPNFGNSEINNPIRDIYSKILSTFKFTR